MKQIKRTLAAAITMCFMLFLTAGFTASGLESSSVFNITTTKKLVENYTISENEVIYVRDGGTFSVKSDTALKVDGRLKIADGGRLNVYGCIEISKQGLLSCSGKLYIADGASVVIDGRLWINKTGIAFGEGEIKVNDSFSDITCKGTVTAHITAPAPVEKDGITYVGGILLVNKEYSLPENYGSHLTTETYIAYIKMKHASEYKLSIVSGFRSYERQWQVFNNWCSIDGVEKAETYSARPGHSEHQAGLAIDISSLDESYGDTAEGKWLAAHCYEYGFIIRYPKGKENITGYSYEPWHVRYLGTSTAKLVYDSGLTLEEFLGVA